MSRNTRLLFIVCLAAVCGVVLLQSIWISNYYQVNKERFDKEVNLAFEDAIKTEFKLRCDTIESNIYRVLMDTTQISITSRWTDKFNTYLYQVTNEKDTSDKFSFSSTYIKAPIVTTNDSVKQLVARQFAATYRSEDIEKRVIFFRTQSMGKVVTQLVENYKFDTFRLRPIYQQLLTEKDIREPFIFYMRDEDSTLNRSRLPDSLHNMYPVITKSFRTWSTLKGGGYVRAMFQNPVKFLLKKMIGTVLASALLLLMVALTCWYLLRVIRQEKKLSAIKNDFISNISHELKTPIATVAAAVEALEDFDALQNPQRTKRYLQISRTELQRLADMVNKILNIARYEQQDFELKPESIDVDELIDELISKYPLPPDKQIAFQHTSQPGTNRVMADKLHLYNVLNNLIDNAVKYSGPSVTINIQCYREKQYHIITVQDDGIGIAASDLPYIFDKFYRVPSGNVHKVKGHGLGLSYVKHIIEKHGGWCLAESRPGKGSIFKLGLQV
jgi:signal transduction histidine kinase